MRTRCHPGTAVSDHPLLADPCMGDKQATSPIRRLFPYHVRGPMGAASAKTCSDAGKRRARTSAA
jgi:hypothetical protein